MRRPPIKHFRILIPLMLLLSACAGFPGYKTVRITLAPEQTGWYFIEAKQDTAMLDTGEVNLVFRDSIRMLTVNIGHIENTILSPVDFRGNDLSARLKFNGIKQIGHNRAFFSFYNPDVAELAIITNWLPTDPRIRKILDQQEKDFDKLLGRDSGKQR